VVRWLNDHCVPACKTGAPQCGDAEVLAAKIDALCDASRRKANRVLGADALEVPEPRPPKRPSSWPTASHR
jgi:hypothetical protein